MTDIVVAPCANAITLLADETHLTVTRNAASVSLLQRHFMLDYGAACELSKPANYLVTTTLDRVVRRLEGIHIRITT
jgi:hypothetical protein